MNTIKNAFSQFKPSDKIASFNLALAVMAFIFTALSGSIGYLGYSINRAVEERNAHDWKIQQANYRAAFWKEIESVENHMIVSSDQFRTNIDTFSATLMAAFWNIQKQVNDNKMADEIFSAISKSGDVDKVLRGYDHLRAPVQSVVIKYDNSVLMYDSLVAALCIQGWGGYLELGDGLRRWKKAALQPYQDAYIYYLRVARKRKVPDDYFEQVKKHSGKIGFGIRNVEPPSLDIIEKFRESNHPKNNATMSLASCQ